MAPFLPWYFSSPIWMCSQPPLPRISHLHQRPASVWFAPSLLNMNISCLASSTSQVPSAPPDLSWISSLPSQLPAALVLNPTSEISAAVFQWIESSILCFPLLSLRTLSSSFFLFPSGPLSPADINCHSQSLPYMSQRLHVRHLCWEVSWPVTHTGQVINIFLGVI